MAGIVTGIISLIVSTLTHVQADTSLFVTVFATSVTTVLALDFVRYFND